MCLKFNFKIIETYIFIFGVWYFQSYLFIIAGIIYVKKENEMLYMDGMNIGRGFDVIYNKAFMWHNQIDLTYPLVYQMLAVEAFGSATGVTRTLSDLSDFGNIDWYFAAGIGLKMQIPGFPLGLYLVENWTYKRASGFQWVQTGIGQTGLKLVLAITTSYY